MNIRTTIQRLKRKSQKRFLTPRAIANICKSENPVLRAVGAALEAQFTGELTEGERMWIESIENLRAIMSRSTESIVTPDYGAGTPDDARSWDQMSGGSTTTETVGQACQQYSKPRVWAMLLFHLIRKLKPLACVELGACLGLSAAYQTAALELNGAGRLVTLEGAPSFAAIASRNLESLALTHRASVVVGRFEDALGNVLNGFGKVDYAFIDGHHDERATIRYFDQIILYLSDRALVVFDDIAWSPGMQRAWQRISDDPRVDVTIDFLNMGVALVGLGVKARYRLTIA